MNPLLVTRRYQIGDTLMPFSDNEPETVYVYFEDFQHIGTKANVPQGVAGRVVMVTQNKDLSGAITLRWGTYGEDGCVTATFLCERH